MNDRRNGRAWVVATLATMLLAAACSVSQTIAHPRCDGNGGSWVITAQSVPTATLVPCFEPLPRGWDIDSVSIGENGTTIVMGSDRAGSVAAVFHFQETCDVVGAVSTPSDRPRTERFERIISLTPEFRASRYDRFAGGCTWWDFEFDEGTPSALSVELGNTVQLHSRTELQDQLNAEFLEEEL